MSFRIKLDNIMFWKYKILSQEYEGRNAMKFDFFKHEVYFTSEKHHTMFQLTYADLL